MAAFFRETLQRINSKEKAPCKTKKERNIKEDGKEIKNMEMVSTHGKMVIITKEHINSEKDKVMEQCTMSMGKYTKATGSTV